MRKQHLNRIAILSFFTFIFTGIILLKLFQLQVIQGSHYRKIADRNHYGNTELPARRGEIIIKDPNSQEEYFLGKNITLDLLYADPTLVEEKDYVVKKIAPIIYNAEEAREIDKQRVADEIAKAETEEDLEKIKPLTDEELYQNFENYLMEKIKHEKRSYVKLSSNPTDELKEKVAEFGLTGIYIEEGEIYANPQEINDPESHAKLLAPFLDIQVVRLKNMLIGKNRYTVLKRKLRPETSIKLKELMQNEKDKFFGLRLQEEYYRFYPEKDLAAQVIGFVDHSNNGQTGIEAFFQKELEGENGIFTSQKDGTGNQITVGESIIKPAIDGDDIMLTIDRTIQLEVEKKLAHAVKSSKADQGQAIVMEPQTGRILALAHYPTFDPNNFSEVYEKKDIGLNEEEKDMIEKKSEENPTYFFYIDREKDDKIELFPKKDLNNNIGYQMYKNRVGPAVYRNRVVADLYEPGSVFKVFTMAAGLNANEVEPYTTIEETGPRDVDFNVITEKYEHRIRNALDKYRGQINMTEVLQYSSNIGISYVAEQLGKSLFYDYILKFGFGKRTYISFLNEKTGTVSFYKNWSESDHLTHGFGQGLSATPIQVITAMASIANGGIMVQPRIVDEIRHKTENGQKIEKYETQIINRTISKETADTLTAMMTNAVENGIPQAKCKNHFIAGKTGTSQTYKYGKPLHGVGTTIASMGGFGPVNNPKFVILVKIDKPRSAEWGSVVAAPLFREIAEFLYDYYNIPPDKEL